MPTMKQTLAIAGGIGLAVLASWLYQHYTKPFVDPVNLVYFSRPEPLSRKFVSEITINLDGKDITKGEAVVHSNQEVTITGKCVPNPKNSQEYLVTGLIICFRPPGTPQWDWEQPDPTYWDITPFPPIKFVVPCKAPPGDYDVRVYALASSQRTSMPEMEHILDGKMKVIP